ncbi:MAG: type II toxin-antitoxin system PemK/MazF family toxin [Chloroflexi bacterium CG_4_10_14_0_8_um_filter_57_5]|nr:MAG: type II toxin-antitoxin system PemK/MazF family toxin [Anaerolineae bacterium CG17_big_fil_post_rev_8_21_14_2_50_57_27]PIZ26313.1 MAG: type II toxin-antitoxin system PemK/MazF family toxin [Chloroflexi bacterium CG_4_10_14_0_8_um_filter_57_5]
MRRGEIWWVNFDPSIGSEIQKQRPAVVVSNDISNKYVNRVQVVPITSKVEKLYPSEAYVTVGGRQGKAMADQLATVSKERLIRLMGHVTAIQMMEIEKAIRIQLAL